MPQPCPAARLLAPSPVSSAAKPLRALTRPLPRLIAPACPLARRRFLTLPSLRWEPEGPRDGQQDDHGDGRPDTSTAEADAQHRALNGPAEVATRNTYPSPQPLRHLRGKARRTHDIVPGDLEGTLETHRAANRAATIRKVNVPDPRFSDDEIPEWARAPKDSWRMARERDATGPDVAPQLADDALDELISRLSHKSTPSERDIDDVIDALRKPETDPEPDSPPESRQVEAADTQLLTRWRTIDLNAPFRPWKLPSTAEVPENDSQRFEEELRHFAAWAQPTDSERLAAEELHAAAYDVIAKTIPGATIELHGSRATGMADALSDIDFAVTLSMFSSGSLNRGPSLSHPDAKRTAHLALQKLQQAFGQSNRFTKVFYASEARVPILGARDVLTGLSVQVSVNTPFVAVREMTRYWSRRVPFARPIYLLLRQLLSMRGLAKAQAGGIGGYSLFVLVVAALSHAERSHGGVRAKTLGEAFQAVNRFLREPEILAKAYIVDPPLAVDKGSIREVIELQQTGSEELLPYLVGLEFLIKQNNNRLQRGLRDLKNARKNMQNYKARRLMLQDPANPYNDLGSKASRIVSILALLKEAYDTTMVNRAAYKKLHGNITTIDATPLLDPYLKAGWRDFLARRSRVCVVELQDLVLLSSSVKTTWPSREEGITSEASSLLEQAFEDTIHALESRNSATAMDLSEDELSQLPVEHMNVFQNTQGFVVPVAYTEEDCPEFTHSKELDAQWHELLATRVIFERKHKNCFWFADNTPSSTFVFR